MDKYVLVSYELQGTCGQIIVKDGTPIETIKEYCAIDRFQKAQESLIKRVKIKKDSE